MIGAFPVVTNVGSLRFPASLSCCFYQQRDPAPRNTHMAGNFIEKTAWIAQVDPAEEDEVFTSPTHNTDASSFGGQDTSEGRPTSVVDEYGYERTLEDLSGQNLDNGIAAIARQREWWRVKFPDGQIDEAQAQKWRKRRTSVASVSVAVVYLKPLFLLSRSPFLVLILKKLGASIDESNFSLPHVNFEKRFFGASIDERNFLSPLSPATARAVNMLTR